MIDNEAAKLRLSIINLLDIFYDERSMDGTDHNNNVTVTYIFESVYTRFVLLLPLPLPCGFISSLCKSHNKNLFFFFAP